MNRIIATLTLLIAALTAAAASTPEVSLVTVFPGTDIYELDGHLVIEKVEEYVDVEQMQDGEEE